ncbi:MAG TPA: sigma-70 family RNA polymerase sigma factor [Gemmataceae bacterium]
MSSSALTAGVRGLRDRLAAQRDQHASDEQLLHAFTTRREESAFAVLVHRHGPMVLHVCRRVLGHEQDAEDAFQATFLVLARTAAALRNKTALASWLHGTAYRTAMKAKQSAARRRKHEGQATPRPPADPSGELLWREVRTLLDEEVARLPEIYRSAFILCCLESISQAEAARRLGVKEGTVSSRLTEARKRLQLRLSRRGVELTALLAATALTTETASALPTVLLTKAIRGVVSPAVAALADSVSTILSAGKIKLAAAFVLVASVLTSAGWWAYRRPAAPSAQLAELPIANASDKPKTTPPKREAAKTVEIHGRVLGPDGKPKAGAKLLLLGRDKKIVELGVTAADGLFSVLVPKEAKHRCLIARTDDTGIDICSASNLKAGKPVEMHLVKDQPIRGRVVNTEGKPVAGVRVAATNVNIYPNNSLDRFLAHWKNRSFGVNPLGGGFGVGDAAAVLFAATTDAEGRFVLHGLGEERFIPLRLSGAGLAEAELWVVTRPNFDPKPFNQAVLDNTSKDRLQYLGQGRSLHGPDVTFVAEPEKILRGIVKEADTGKGRPNVLVHLYQRRGVELQARTDAKGRYEIRSARKAKSYNLVVPSDPLTGYIGYQIKAEDTPGYQPVAADITVKKGVIITGKMIDRATGKPVDGHMTFDALRDNPFVKEYPGFDSTSWYSVGATDANGVFRIVTIPGPVLLMGGPSFHTPEFKYKRSVVDPKYRQYFREEPHEIAYYLPGGGYSLILGIYFKVLEIKPDAKVIEQDVVLERLPALTVQIQDTDGKPLTHVYVVGITDQGAYPEQFAESSGSVYGVQPGKPRAVIFYHPMRKLAGTITLKGDEKQPVAVKLRPAGAIKGRLLDADGKPLAGVRIDLSYHRLRADAMHRCIQDYKQIETDAKGAFTFDNAIPGITFDLSFRRGRQRFERETKPADPAIQVEPGECRDVGVIKLKRAVEKAGE